MPASRYYPATGWRTAIPLRHVIILSSASLRPVVTLCLVEGWRDAEYLREAENIEAD